MPTKAKKTKDPVTFDVYKSIKDEIIEISEQRFENILTKRLKEFKDSLMEYLNVKFDSLEKRISFLTWFLPVFMTFLMLTLKYFDK